MRILDYGKNGHFSKDLQIFLTEFSNFFSSFSSFFKLFRDEEYFDNLSYFRSSDQGFESKRLLFAVFG